MPLRSATRPGVRGAGQALQKGRRPGCEALAKPLTPDGRPHAICRAGLQKPACSAASAMQFALMSAIADTGESVCPDRHQITPYADRV
jgi:hypothetical protein